MADSPLPALRAEYEQIARRLDGVTHASEREVVKREIIAYFKRVDAFIGELSALKEDIRKLVDRFKQVTASTAEAAAPERRAASSATRRRRRYPRPPTFSKACSRTREPPSPWWTCGSGSAFRRRTARRPAA